MVWFWFWRWMARRSRRCASFSQASAARSAHAFGYLAQQDMCQLLITHCGITQDAAHYIFSSPLSTVPHHLLLCKAWHYICGRHKDGWPAAAALPQARGRKEDAPLLDEVLRLSELDRKDKHSRRAALWALGLWIHVVTDGPHAAQCPALTHAGERAVRAEPVAALQAQRLVHCLLRTQRTGDISHQLWEHEPEACARGSERQALLPAGLAGRISMYNSWALRVCWKRRCSCSMYDEASGNTPMA